MFLLAPNLAIKMVQWFIAYGAGYFLQKMLKPHVSRLQDVFLFNVL
jgi:hypothetical protein